jgi:hypothetical protein
LLEIEVSIDQDELEKAEVIEEGRSYREWCLPAESLDRCSVRLIES